MTTIQSRVAAGLLSFIFLTLAQGLDAHEMSVVSAEKSISGRTWKIQGGFANQPEAQLNEGMKALAEGLPIEQLQLDPNAVRSNATSGLLALEYSQWLKINELESSGKQWYRVEPKEMTERVEAKLVVVGTIPAVQIVVQQSIKQEPNFELDFTLLGDLLVTAGDTKSVNNTSFFADVFLNDIPSQTEKQQSLRYLANELGKSSHSIQGTHRVSYNTGNQLSYISIPDEITSATLPNVYHQGQLVKPLTQNGSTLLTYLPTRTNLGSDQRDVLFLENGNPFGTSDFASTRPAFLTLSPTGIEVEQQRERTYADNLIYERATPLPVRERFVMYRVSRNQTRTTQLPFNDRLSTSTVEVSARLLSVTTTPGFSPDHYARLTIGGSQGPFELSWTGRREVQFEQTISLSPSTYSGGNTPISLAHQVPAITGGPSADIQNLEEITLRWTGYPRVDSTQRLLLELPAPAPGDELLPRRVTIGGFPAGTLPSSLVLLDVTDERNPIMVSGFPMFTDLSGTRALEFEATPGSTTFYVQPLSTISTLPAAVAITPLPELPPNGTPLKGIYVCPAEYKTALQPLVDYRGPGFIVLDPKAAFDHYSYGQESPEAIRDAIRDLIASASDVAEIPSIVLVGYATFDARNYLGLIAEPQVPTFMEESLDFGFTLETCLDFPYGLLFGDDDLIDAMVSRLPAKNAAEVTGMVNRILAHAAAESELSALERPGVFVYDKDAEILVDQGYWETLWEPTLRTFDQVTVAESSNGSAEKGILISLLSRGPKAPSFVLYMGHGNNDRWSSQLLRTPDISTFTTHGGYPMVVTFTCLNAYYAFPGATVRTLAESFMIAEENKGAISVYAPCSADVYFFQKEKAEAMMNRMSARRRPLTIGEWTTLARLDFAIEHPELARTNSEYLLFGDNLSPTTIPRTNTQVDWEFIQSRFD